MVTTAMGGTPDDNDNLTIAARKRRREYLEVQRSLDVEALVDETLGIATATAAAAAHNIRKKYKVSEDDASSYGSDESESVSLEEFLGETGLSTTLHKSTVHALQRRTTTKMSKPYKKYEPDVPMSKKDTAIWRREQRRKRNRESAAASRQRQRDRMDELQRELETWKSKYEVVLNQVQQLEASIGSSIAVPIITSNEKIFDAMALTPERFTKRLPPTTLHPDTSLQTVTPRASPELSPKYPSNSRYYQGSMMDGVIQLLPQEIEGEGELVPCMMFSRPAVS